MSNMIFKCQRITLLLTVYLLEAFSKPYDIKFDVTGYIHRGNQVHLLKLPTILRQMKKKNI